VHPYLSVEHNQLSCYSRKFCAQILRTQFPTNVRLFAKLFYYTYYTIRTKTT